jgi:hypothetical protein
MQRNKALQIKADKNHQAETSTTTRKTIVKKIFVPAWIVLKKALEVDKACSKKGSKRLKRLKQLKQCASQEYILQSLKALGSQYASRCNRFFHDYQCIFNDIYFGPPAICDIKLIYIRYVLFRQNRL